MSTTNTEFPNRQVTPLEKRVLVTGSRDWGDAPAIRGALHEWWVAAGWPKAPVLVSGACPTGADAIAEHLWSQQGWPVELHPVTLEEWSSVGPKAGPERNRRMVNAGADVCFAFVGFCSSPRCRVPGDHWSHGATGCAELAREAGIRTHMIYAGQ